MDIGYWKIKVNFKIPPLAKRYGTFNYKFDLEIDTRSNIAVGCRNGDNIHGCAILGNHFRFKWNRSLEPIQIC